MRIKFMFLDHAMEFEVRSTKGAVSQTFDDHVVLREAFTENTYSLHPDHFNDTGIMVDAGANIGAVSILAARLGAKKVFAFEPEPENFGLLIQNIELNHLHDVIIPRNIGLWSHGDHIQLVSSQGTSTSRPEDLARFPDQVIWVPVRTLGQVLGPYVSIDVLKVDTEGAEYEFLTDPTVNKKARLILGEFHHTTKETFGNLLATLSMTHNVQAWGHFDGEGGQFIARRY